MRGDGRIFNRNGIYWIAYYHRGTEIRESSRSTDERDAEGLLKHRRAEVGADRLGARSFVGPAQDRLTVSDLLDALEKNYEIRGKKGQDFVSHLKPVRAAFGDLRAVNCTETMIERVIADWRREKRAPGTINREIQLLGQAFKLAVEHKRLSLAPKIKRLPDDAVREGFFESAEFEKVVRHLPNDIKDFARFAYLSAWRKSEIASLEWSDVDLAGRMIHLKATHSKNRKPRKVALEGELWEIVQRRLALKETLTDHGVAAHALVFRRADNMPVGDFRKAWNSALKAAKIPKRVFHDLRRSGIRNMVRGGVSETVAMRISGHRTRSIFQRYDITAEADLREAAKKIDLYTKRNGQNTDN